jgi:hypothetical protein
MSKNKLRLGVVAAAAVAALAFGTAAPAYADPSGFKDLVGVGSDTTQDLVGGLASVIPAIGNYDAVGTPTIQTRAGGTFFTRPNGSTTGIQALSASINDTGVRTFPASGPGAVSITDQVDFARSSSGPNQTQFPGTQLTFIPFARDAVTFAVSAASDFPRDIALGSASQDSLSPAPFTLRNIYRGTVTTYVDSNLEPVTIRPIIPQQGSGTRSFWLSALGLTEGTIVGTPTTDIGNTAQEHNGTYIKNAGDIAPFSVAQYIAQGNHGALPTSITERRGNIELGNVGTIKPLLLTPGGGVELNTSFPINRLVYNVVETARLTGTSAEDVALQTAFVGTTSSVCAASATIKQYGFGTIGSLCGNTTTYRQGYRF